MLVEQDGIYGALHTVSKDGTLIHSRHDADGRTAQGLPVWGYDFPPGRVAIQTPAAAAGRRRWMAGLIDDKPVRSRRRRRRPRAATSSRRCGGAPISAAGTGSPRPTSAAARSTCMAQWVRAPQKATRMEDIGTLTMRYAANEPDLANTHEGHSDAGGPAAHLPEPQPRHRLRQAARQPRALPARLRQGRAGRRSRSSRP